MAAATAERKDIKWLAEHIEGTLGEAVPAARLRQVLRGLVAAGEIEHENKSGWTFTGIKDPAVKALIARLKEQGTATPRKAKKDDDAAPKKSRRKKTPAPVEEDEDVLEDDELDLD